MARIRSVKPELRTSLTAADWPREVRYFWVLLWGYLDDEGRGVDEPRLIKADCFPLDDDITAGDIDKWLDLIAASGSLCRYSVNGHRYLHAPSWDDHQHPQHPKRSKIIPCDREPHGEPSRTSHENFTTLTESRSDNAISNATTPITGVSNVKEREKEREAGDNPAREDVEKLCAHLADKIAANGSKRPAVTQKWRDAARLMLDKDGRTEADIRKAIDWCQADDFWRANVMSMPTLREKYDQLRLHAQRQRASPRGPAPSSLPAGTSPRQEHRYRR